MISRNEIFDVISLAHRPAYGDGWVMVMVCYLDDSDAQQSSVATLAGYVATAENWKIVEQHLEDVCLEYGVRTLHAKEFHDTKDDFEGWTRTKKTKFVDDLYAKAKLITWGIECSGGKDWSAQKLPFPVHHRTSLYGVLFSSIMFRLLHDNPLAGIISNAGLSFLVESGHNNNQEIEKYFQNVSNFDYFKGSAKSISFAKDSSRAIQLADFLAFHARRFAALRAANGTASTKKHAEILHRVHSKVPHLVSILPKMSVTKIGSFDEFQKLRGRGV